ncbi:MAG: hypothetical protein QNJ44_00495 [Rhodobacter sp.]|nr:hypothetical protein [Rhodobacter sp.]
MDSPPSLHRHVQDGSDVLIWDGLFSPDFVTSLYKTLNNTEYDSLSGDQAYRSWVCPFDVEDFSGHPLFQRTCEAFAEEHPGLQPKCLSAKAQVLTFGDFVPLQAPLYDSDVRSVLYFANSEWREEWAAETILFSKDQGGALAIPPKPGRVALFQANQTRRLGVPSRLTHLTSVVVQFEVEMQ